MRVVGGRLRGRPIIGPDSEEIRPTSDRLRETIFNVLAHTYSGVEGHRVLDLFAGTGALGFEALSRGAAFVLFVDQATESLALLRRNIEKLHASPFTRILRRDAARLGSMPPQPTFSLAFLDPPYGRDLAAPSLESLRDGGWLSPDALCVVEDSRDARLEPPEGFSFCDSRNYSKTQLVFLRRTGPDVDS